MVTGHVVYLDASALVKLAVPETESAAMLAFVERNRTQVTSVVATVEVPRVLVRLGISLGDREAAILAEVGSIWLDPTVAARAVAIGPTGLRTLDAIHLASAMELGWDLAAFVTYDRRLADAATALGLPVVSPS